LPTRPTFAAGDCPTLCKHRGESRAAYLVQMADIFLPEPVTLRTEISLIANPTSEPQKRLAAK